MLVFIGVLRHPEMANDYEKVETLLHQTLLSVCNQDDFNFKVLLVCNRQPHISQPLYGGFVEFIEVAFQCPSKVIDIDVSMRKTALYGVRKDKGTKYIVGIVEAQKFKPDYIMFFDTDDFVSSDIAGFVNSSGNSHNGWYIDKGYIHCHDTGLYYEDNRFNQLCGTCLIVNNELLINPVNRGSVIIHTPDGAQAIDTGNTSFVGSITRHSSHKEIMDTVDNNFLHYIIGRHSWAAQYYNLSPLPFRGAIWNINTGENVRGYRKIKKDGPIELKDINIHKFIPECGIKTRL